MSDSTETIRLKLDLSDTIANAQALDAAIGHAGDTTYELVGASFKLVEEVEDEARAIARATREAAAFDDMLKSMSADTRTATTAVHAHADAHAKVGISATKAHNDLTRSVNQSSYRMQQFGQTLDDLQYVGEMGIRPIINNLMQISAPLGIVVLGFESLRKAIGPAIADIWKAFNPSPDFRANIDKLTESVEKLKKEANDSASAFAALAVQQKLLDQAEADKAALKGMKAKGTEEEDETGKAIKAVIEHAGGGEKLAEIMLQVQKQEGQFAKANQDLIHKMEFLDELKTAKAAADKAPLHGEAAVPIQGGGAKMMPVPLARMALQDQIEGNIAQRGDFGAALGMKGGLEHEVQQRLVAANKNAQDRIAALIREAADGNEQAIARLTAFAKANQAHLPKDMVLKLDEAAKAGEKKMRKGLEQDDEKESDANAAEFFKRREIDKKAADAAAKVADKGAKEGAKIEEDESDAHFKEFKAREALNLKRLARANVKAQQWLKQEREEDEALAQEIADRTGVDKLVAKEAVKTGKEHEGDPILGPGGRQMKRPDARGRMAPAVLSREEATMIGLQQAQMVGQAIDNQRAIVQELHKVAARQNQFQNGLNNLKHVNKMNGQQERRNNLNRGQ